MSSNHGLPFLPGNTFKDVTKTCFHRPQTLGYRNGYPLAHRPTVGIGQEPLPSVVSTQQQINELSLKVAALTDDPPAKTIQQDFIPAYVALDKKVLRFYAYFSEDVLYSPEEKRRVRPVTIYYFLEDDSLSIFEPPVKNSGLPQGVRLKRHRVPKNDGGDHYLWKDLNLGMDLSAYGVKYHITDCDDFTKEFLTSEGILLNEPEPTPEGPYKNPHTLETEFQL